MAKRRPTVLLTGFSPFGGDAGNPMPPPMVSMPPTGTMAPPGMMPPVTNPRGAQQR